MIKYASLFSGIGGFELGIQAASKQTGIKTECVFASEFDPESKAKDTNKQPARIIYNKNFGEYPHGDITKINASDVPDCDLIVGGPPCQDFSIAGKRAGLCGTKGSMFNEFIRVAQEKQPRYLLIENVKGILSSNAGWDFARILIELEDAGYSCEGQVLNTKNYLPQNRERVFLVGHLAGSERSGPQIFPIGESNCRIDERAEQTAVNTLTAGGHSGGHHSSMTLLCDSGQGRKNQSRDETIAPLRANTGAGHNNIVCHSTLPRSSKSGEGGTGRLSRADGTTYCLDAANNLAVEFIDTKQRGPPRHSKECPTLQASCYKEPVKVSYDGNIRRLTPTEAELLQGFPRGWTKYGKKVLYTVQVYGNTWNQIHVQSMGVIEKLSTENLNCVSCITKDGKGGEIQLSNIPPTEKTHLPAISMDVIDPHIVEKCVCDITNHGNGTVIHVGHKKTSKIETRMLNINTLESMGWNCTEPLLNVSLDEKLKREKASIILTWIKETMMNRTFIYAKTHQPISNAIVHWRNVPHNSSRKDSLFLRMENITKIADTNRYRCIGNSVTVPVVADIMQKILKEMV